MKLTRATVRSPFGRFVVEGDDDGLTRIYLPHEAASATKAWSDPVRSAAKQLEEYFAGERTDFDVDLHVAATDFQVDVWSALMTVPYGQVVTYQDIARAVGRPRAFRAVGNANGKNPFPVIVPCHRIVASNGLGGYAGGLSVKRALLALEGVSY